MLGIDVCAPGVRGVAGVARSVKGRVDKRHNGGVHARLEVTESLHCLALGDGIVGDHVAHDRRKHAECPGLDGEQVRQLCVVDVLVRRCMRGFVLSGFVWRRVVGVVVVVVVVVVGSVVRGMRVLVDREVTAATNVVITVVPDTKPDKSDEPGAKPTTESTTNTNPHTEPDAEPEPVDAEPVEVKATNTTKARAQQQPRQVRNRQTKHNTKTGVNTSAIKASVDNVNDTKANANKVGVNKANGKETNKTTSERRVNKVKDEEEEDEEEVEENEEVGDFDDDGLALGPFKESRTLNEVFPELAIQLRERGRRGVAHTNVEVFLTFENVHNKPKATYDLYREALAALNECVRNTKFCLAARSVVHYFHSPTQTGWFAWRSAPWVVVKQAAKTALQCELLKFMRAANKVLSNKNDDDYMSKVDTTNLEQLYHGTRVAIPTWGLSLSDISGTKVGTMLKKAGVPASDHHKVAAYVAPYDQYIVSSTNKQYLDMVANYVEGYVADLNDY